MAQPPVQDQAGSAPSTTAGDPSRKTEFGYVDHVIDMREPDSRSAWVTHKTPIVVIQRHGNLTRYKIKADGNDPVDSNAGKSRAECISLDGFRHLRQVDLRSSAPPHSLALPG